MRILFLCHSFNSLSQRLFVELRMRGHEVSVEFDINDAVAMEAVELYEPDIVVASFLKRAIPRSIWESRICLVVHPGPIGDGGPSALDWAILEGKPEWGVTVLQAESELDAGPVWAHRKFAMRDGRKSSLYRHEVTDAAVEAVLEAIGKIEAGDAPSNLHAMGVAPVWRVGAKQADRAIDWRNDDTDTVLRKIASADGMPGVRDTLFDETVFLFDAHRADGLSGEPGAVIARSGGAIARATRDGAVWIGHVRKARDKAIKLPATSVFHAEAESLPERPGYEDIRYEELGEVGFLHFAFYNGAMGTRACERLLEAWREALKRPTRVIVLMGGPDHWSNGLNLNLIEAAASPADESWANINAMDDLAEAVIRATDRIVVSAVGGNAGAGGVFLARAADEVWLRQGAVLNPHYKDMGNLYGSEFWTYLLPRHAGAENSKRIAAARLPMGAREALSLGLADEIIHTSREDFEETVRDMAQQLAGNGTLDARLRDKAERRARDEAVKPLEQYRAEELQRMKRNFHGFDPSYHVARYNFVHKVPKSRTPITIARHRANGANTQSGRRAAS
ncbi:hydrogenase maturation protein [Oricola thermophila]|uniref:Hydrogenase maturation protein n=1 Tax=Oricola thermophila TaxID=2742145 RepID=A0A6N1V8Q8_9HYPH|nr:hydrogenase maturation protein [Oricola thermophila]QKV17324.1 hydrogenase maturation protein [Oricola thermophila]